MPCREENASILEAKWNVLPYFSLWDSGVFPLWHKMMGDGSQNHCCCRACGPGICGICPLAPFSFLCKSQTFFSLLSWQRLLHDHPRAIMGTVINDSQNASWNEKALRAGCVMYLISRLLTSWFCSMYLSVSRLVGLGPASSLSSPGE